MRVAIAFTAFALAGCFPATYLPREYTGSSYYGSYGGGYPYAYWPYYKRHYYDDCDSDSHGYHDHHGGRYDPHHPRRRVLRPQRRHDDPAGHPGAAPLPSRPPTAKKPSKDTSSMPKPWKKSGPPSAKPVQAGPGGFKQPITRAPRPSVPGSMPTRTFHTGGPFR